MIMKQYIKLLGLGATLFAITGLTSCHDEQGLLTGEGTLMIRASVNTDIRVNARSTADELAEQCLIHVYNSKGLVREYKGINSVPAEGIKLMADSYVAEAWTGDSVSASFDQRWFKGRQEFVVTNAQTTQVDLVCKIANVVAAVEYSDNIDEVLTDYELTVGHNRGTLLFEGRDDRWGYFMMPNADKNLTWTLTGTQANGEPFTRTGTIVNVNPATLYTVKVDYKGGEGPEIGAGYITIQIDETALEINEEIEIVIAPLIKGVGFDIDSPLMTESGKVGRREIVVGASSALTSLVLVSDEVASRMSSTGNDFDLFNATDEIRDALRNAGVEWIYNYDSENDVSGFNLILSADLLDGLEEGTHTFEIAATDSNSKTTRKTFSVVVTDADVMTLPVDERDVWATKATVSATIMKPSVTNPVIMYRPAGTQAWLTAEPAQTGEGSFSVVLTGLTPGTTYEYFAKVDGYDDAEVMKFTTEADAQMPNSSFDEWDESGKTHLIYAPGGTMFWDSGNHGSSTMNKNVTTRSTDKVHHGTSSIKLTSQFVGIGSLGAFAAGNVFVGKFLDTNGTNGILGWGRKWETRPTTLTGWYHYTPQAVTHSKTNPGNVATGDMDRGIIYIAILDDSTKDYKNEKFPVIVKTKEQEFFSKNDDNVIAYGELIITEATPGDELVPFSIKLNYVRKDVKASNIMVVASASQYGDYFTGGPSVLYLDDLKLEY